MRETPITIQTGQAKVKCMSFLRLTLLSGMLTLSACTTMSHNASISAPKDMHVASRDDGQASPQTSPSETQQPADTTSETATKTEPVASNPLIEGLPARDIACIQAEAKRVYHHNWENIAKRSRYVRARILPILKGMHAPQQLEIVPVAESGYNPYAFSPVGATGLWQVMPGTADVLGMDAPKGYDPRRYVESSTRGGVQYLLSLHAMFGNWPLAFAAYHRGPGSIEKRLRHHPWKPEDGLDKLPVPLVTRTYVRGILGLSVLVQRGVWQFPKPWETHQVTLEGPIDVNQLAKAADIDSNEIYRFNPGLNHSQYLNSSLVLEVPDSMIQPIMANADQAAPEYVHIKVRHGDNLSLLAHRHHTNIHDLKRLNPSLTALLHPGQTILVPAEGLNSAHPPLNPLLAQGRRIHYRVRNGDNLWTIAHRFGTTISAIARANSIHHNKTLHPGDHLWVLARASDR
jgi:peptidoglycan lytic transglycosylase D